MSVCVIQGEGGWGLGGLQLFIQGDKGLIYVWRRETMSSLEENKCRVIGTKKQRKTLAENELCEELLKGDIWGETLLG